MIIWTEQSHDLLWYTNYSKSQKLGYIDVDSVTNYAL